MKVQTADSQELPRRCRLEKVQTVQTGEGADWADWGRRRRRRLANPKAQTQRRRLADQKAHNRSQRRTADKSAPQTKALSHSQHRHPPPQLYVDPPVRPPPPPSYAIPTGEYWLSRSAGASERVHDARVGIAILGQYCCRRGAACGRSSRRTGEEAGERAGLHKAVEIGRASCRERV